MLKQEHVWAYHKIEEFSLNSMRKGKQTGDLVKIYKHLITTGLGSMATRILRCSSKTNMDASNFSVRQVYVSKQYEWMWEAIQDANHA